MFKTKSKEQSVINELSKQGVIEEHNLYLVEKYKEDIKDMGLSDKIEYLANTFYMKKNWCKINPIEYLNIRIYFNEIPNVKSIYAKINNFNTSTVLKESSSTITKEIYDSCDYLILTNDNRIYIKQVDITNIVLLKKNTGILIDVLNSNIEYILDDNQEEILDILK